jgi:hypothetical protein
MSSISSYSSDSLSSSGASFVARYPGVRFEGDLSKIRIGPSVQIKAGSAVKQKGYHTIEITGETRIGRNVVVSCDQDFRISKVGCCCMGFVGDTPVDGDTIIDGSRVKSGVTITERRAESPFLQIWGGKRASFLPLSCVI